MTEPSAEVIRAHFARITIPAGPVHLAPHLQVTEPAKYIDTNIERLESPCARLRTLAFEALQLIADKLNHPIPEG